MHPFLLTFLISLLTLSLQAKETTPLTFEQLKSDDFSTFEGQLVQMRGFLSPHPNGGWVLAPYPHVKSCCIGSSSNSQEQVFIAESLSDVSTSYALTIQGIVKKRASIYYLEQAHLIKSSTIPLLFEIGTASLLVLLIYTCINLIRRE